MSLSVALLQNQPCIHYVFEREGEKGGRENNTAHMWGSENNLGEPVLSPLFEFQGFNWGDQDWQQDPSSAGPSGSAPRHFRFTSSRSVLLFSFLWVTNSVALPCPVISTYSSFYFSALSSSIANKFHVHVVDDIHTTSFRYMH